MIEKHLASRHNAQPNDPARFGPALCTLVDAEDPPLRLTLGEDGVQHLRNELASVPAEVDRREVLSRSTTFRGRFWP